MRIFFDIFLKNQPPSSNLDLKKLGGGPKPLGRWIQHLTLRTFFQHGLVQPPQPPSTEKYLPPKKTIQQTQPSKKPFKKTSTIQILKPPQPSKKLN